MADIEITWSSEDISSTFVPIYGSPYYTPIGVAKLKDKEYGPVEKQDVSCCLRHTVWQVEAEYESGEVYLYKYDTPLDRELLFTQVEIEYISLSWDQQGRPMVAYLYQGDIYLWWYDPVAADIVITLVATGEMPTLRIDDARKLTRGTESKVTLMYKVGTTMKYRSQLDRWFLEYDTTVNQPEALLNTISYGMNNINRMQLQYEGEVLGGYSPLYEFPEDDIIVPQSTIPADVAIPATYYKGVTQTNHLVVYPFYYPFDNTVNDKFIITSLDDAVNDEFDVWIGGSDCKTLGYISGADFLLSGCTMTSGLYYLYIRPIQEVSGFTVILS